MSVDDEPRVDAPRRGYNLRSGRRIEYASPSVSRISCSPALDDVITGEGLMPGLSSSLSLLSSPFYICGVIHIIQNSYMLLHG